MSSVLATLIADGVKAFDERNFRVARTHFSRAVLREPDSAEARFWLGAAQYHMGNLREARKHLQRVEAETPLVNRPAAVHEYLCRAYLPENIDRALAVALAGSSRAPDDPRMRLALGDVYLRLERHDEALAEYDAAWKLEGGRSDNAADPHRPGQVPFARSSVFVLQKNWRAALEAVDAAIAREEGHAAYHNRRSVILFEGFEDVAGAIAPARRATELDPRSITSGGDGVYWFNLATYLHAQGRNAEALDAIDQATALSPRPGYRTLQGALLLGAQGKTMAGPSPVRALDFSKVGGMNALKEQVRRVIEVVHTRRDEAAQYGIVRNGLLLYGPPGCGKTFFAEAMAGEFGLEFIRVDLTSAISRVLGGAPEQLDKVFADAKRRAPCLLFFDEFDAIAPKRDQTPSNHEQQMVNALLQQIDEIRKVPGVVLAAATNRLRQLDPAAIREGRFDYKVKIYRPDFDARRAILEALLTDRPHDDTVDTNALAHATDGFSAAQVRSVVDGAAMGAMEAQAPISHGHLESALRERLQALRYAGPHLEWADLILPTGIKRKLQFIERFLENPELVGKLGIEPPTGLLLHGPPGTGKTTIARVLASQTDASFLAVNAADVFSKWFGESEHRVRELFERARDNVPAIVFIDEIDAILGSRSGGDDGGTRASNSVVNTFLSEMDGIAGNRRVFIIGATNRPELVDEAVLRPGRLSEIVEIGLPGVEGRLAMLQLFSARMMLGPEVDLGHIAGESEGGSGADLRGLCTAAGRNALLRELDVGNESPAITANDFAGALEELFPERALGDRNIGFLRSE